MSVYSEGGGGISDGFTDTEKVIQSKLIPALFGDHGIGAADNFSMLMSLSVKHTGLTLSYPTISGTASYDVSILVCSHLLAAFRCTQLFLVLQTICQYGRTFCRTFQAEGYYSILRNP